MWLKITLVGLIAVAIALSGCGGGGDESDTGGAASTAEATNAASDATEAGSTSGDTSAQADGQPLTKAQLIKAGDKICQRTSAKIVEDWQREKENYGRGFGAQPSEKQNEEGLVDLVLPAIQEEAEEMAELVPPPADRAEIDAIVVALEKGVAQSEANPGAAFAPGAKNPLDEASKLSKAYGFKVCGS
jgi:hypothetical protein